MTAGQRDAVTMIMKKIAGTGIVLVAHHGGCVGADEDFHKVARSAGAIIEIHPGPAPRMRAWLGNDPDLVHAIQPFLVRNRRIVNVSAAMIATPFEPARQVRGGTWYTAGYASERQKPLALVLPRSGGVMIEFSGGWAWPALPKELTK